MADTPTTSPLDRQSARRLDDFYATLRQEAQYFIGYPCNLDFDYRDLFRFLAFPINNVGDRSCPATST